jgi:hypothetical protein
MPIHANIPPRRAPVPRGEVFRRAPSGAIGFLGASYGSPLTESGKPPLGTQLAIGSQVEIPASQSPSPGLVVPLHLFKKVHPYEASAVVSPRSTAVPVVRRAGSVSKDHSTPFHPHTFNSRLQKAATPPQTRPKPTVGIAVRSNTPSFLHHGTVLSSNPHNDVKTPHGSRFVSPTRFPVTHHAAPHTHVAAPKPNRHAVKGTAMRTPIARSR